MCGQMILGDKKESRAENRKSKKALVGGDHTGLVKRPSGKGKCREGSLRALEFHYLQERGRNKCIPWARGQYLKRSSAASEGIV